MVFAMMLPFLIMYLVTTWNSRALRRYSLSSKPLLQSYHPYVLPCLDHALIFGLSGLAFLLKIHLPRCLHRV